MRLTAYDKKTGAYIDSVCTNRKQDALDFVNDFKMCKVETEGECTQW